ncbi:hypothetical protein VC83_03776 [Pseudogymnoascus destructans]|uniref:Uncharacterized protein n=1 Tax=Pseudogymnoascus destructans TaxID=655981 RepID=A0A177AE44_9PEZI|nr:uncharacterized protein VC83_03776 [Pseudogymnoascus destructans]OAF59453.1 hypothetical protein VC83_03776 [Pseudogymnoascus destructans]
MSSSAAGRHDEITTRLPPSSDPLETPFGSPRAMMEEGKERGPLQRAPDVLANGRTGSPARGRIYLVDLTARTKFLPSIPREWRALWARHDSYLSTRESIDFLSPDRTVCCVLAEAVSTASASDLCRGRSLCLRSPESPAADREKRGFGGRMPGVLEDAGLAGITEDFCRRAGLGPHTLRHLRRAWA